jgi:signal recognition particle receptor subunit beta
MPILDKERGVLVVRVVYDGPPMSGKTTTLRALSQGLGVPITSPEERDGRTLYFDWVDYVGGLFEGRQIRCQIVSVPGQKELAKRRQLLLDSADAVVMVADTRASEIGAAYALLRELLPRCRAESPPVGVVIQANKRDAPDSVPRAEIHEQFERIAPLAIVDTVAVTGEGVREAFVFAVRLALDRVRTLAAARRLPEGSPDVSSPEELLAGMKPLSVAPLAFGAPPDTSERVAPALAPTPAVPELERLLAESPPAVELAPGSMPTDERVFTPDPLMPGGFIWPPVDGRMLLHEVARLERTPVLTSYGDWWAAGEGWRFHSAATSLFHSADLGRQQLIEWARLHAANLHRLSTGRTVILADAGGGRFRLWQLVRVAASLRERILTTAVDGGTELLAREIQAAALHLLRARQAFHGSDVCLPCTLWTVSGDLHRDPTFVGLMPKPGAERREEESTTGLLEREFRPLLHHLKLERRDYPEIVRALACEHGVGATYDLTRELLRLASVEETHG